MAEAFGLAVTMSTASVTFVIAAIIWLRLPETLNRAPEPLPEVTPAG